MSVVESNYCIRVLTTAAAETISVSLTASNAYVQ